MAELFDSKEFGTLVLNKVLAIEKLEQVPNGWGFDVIFSNEYNIRFFYSDEKTAIETRNTLVERISLEH